MSTDVGPTRPLKLAVATKGGRLPKRPPFFRYISVDNFFVALSPAANFLGLVPEWRGLKARVRVATGDLLVFAFDLVGVFLALGISSRVVSLFPGVLVDRVGHERIEHKLHE
jgi:hypothetical protein